MFKHVSEIILYAVLQLKKNKMFICLTKMWKYKQYMFAEEIFLDEYSLRKDF